ncbi:tetratricopeptide repeat protein [Indibacter alkaliphilus]|uniref:tetratricopeptide repeat protein n=1 Tax=Indibacter alkaliphilus TaxID=579922 RepID=UPI000282288B|nr:tetratricopeptide repeat protein [Indibacter alkaliphilus]
MKIKIRNFIIIILSFFLGFQAFPQEKLSRKERKKQLEERKASRLFVDGQRFMMLEDFDKAYFYFQKARELSPDDPAINFKIAEILLRANRVDDAMEYGLLAVEGDPENKYYNLVMAEAFSKQGNPEAAADILENLMSNSEENQNYILDLASLYLSAGDYDNALDALNRAEDYYGIVEQLTVQKQRIYLRKNDLESAINEGRNLIEAHPGNSQFVLNLVEILFNNNRSNEAIQLVEESLKAYPNQPDLQMAAYALYKEKGDLETAEDLIIEAFKNPDLEAAVKAEAFSDILKEMKTARREKLLDALQGPMVNLHTNDADVLTVVGDRLYFNDQRQEALEFYEKSIKIDPSNAEVLQGIIMTMFDSGKDFKDIETYTELAVEEFPTRAEFWFFDGTAKLALKKAEEAIESLEKAKEINQGRNKQLDILVQGQMGDSFHQLGEKEKAFKAYESVLKERPDDEHVLNNYAYFLSLAKKDLDKAKKMSERLVKKHPKNSTYLDTHAWVLFQLKEYEEAKKFMELALENEETPSGVMLEHYGDILYHLGKRNEAISFWKQAEGGDETSELLFKKIKDQKYYD